MGVSGIFSKYPKTAHFVQLFTPLRMCLQILFLFPSCSNFPWLRCDILPFFVGACLEEKFVKQNDLFEEFFYSNVLVKYYRIQRLLEEKIFLKKPPLLAVSFKLMT